MSPYVVNFTFTFLTFVNNGRIPEIQNFNPLKICPIIWYFTFGLSCVQVTIPNTLCVGSSVILVLLLEATCISYLVVWFVQGMSILHLKIIMSV